MLRRQGVRGLIDRDRELRSAGPSLIASGGVSQEDAIQTLKQGVSLWENPNMADKAEKTIDEIFREGTAIDNALKQAVREAEQ